MPAIIIKQYTWRQTPDAVIVSVPLRGRPKSVDLFAAADYVKASFPPFMLELFLWSSVVQEASKCTLSEERAVLTLRKADAGSVWDSLETNGLGKQEKRERRGAAFEQARLAAEESRKARSEKRQYLQKEAVRAQINLDTATLNRITALRDAQRKQAMADLEDWRTRAAIPMLREIEGESQENRKAYRPPLKWFKDELGILKSREMTDDEIFRNGDRKRTSELKAIEWKETSLEGSVNYSRTAGEAGSSVEKNGEGVSEDSESDYEDLLPSRRRGRARNIFNDCENACPLPRTCGTIDITFTERAFPTPSRESAHLQEQEWLAKQAEARRKTGFVVEDLRPEEQDPVWLKDKGDEFFKAGNYLAAISAYTHGIKISSGMDSLYANRSAAHYALGNFYRCTEDCSKALELMTPACEGNREARARCHARRGAALCKLSAPQHGIPELEAALRLSPDNESVKRDLSAAKAYFNSKD